MNMTGIHNGIKDMAWNEVSGRYVKFDEEFYYPYWREQSSSNKQGSSGFIEDKVILEEATRRLTFHVQSSVRLYYQLLDMGIAKEQARMVLPVNLYTQWIWTGSLQAFLHVIHLRAKPDAQWETQQYGIGVRNIIEKYFPVCLSAWENKDVKA